MTANHEMPELELPELQRKPKKKKKKLANLGIFWCMSGSIGVAGLNISQELMKWDEDVCLGMWLRRP